MGVRGRPKHTVAENFNKPKFKPLSGDIDESNPQDDSVERTQLSGSDFPEDAVSTTEAQFEQPTFDQFQQLIQHVEYVPTRTPFPSATMAIGKTGTGKSTTNKRIAEESFDSGNCVIDLLDFGRFENACYAIPNTHTYMYDQFNSLLQTFDANWIPLKFEPRAYPTEVFVPAVRGCPEELPSIFVPYRVAFQTIDFKEFISLCGFRGTEVGVDLLSLAWGSKPSQHEGFEAFVKRAILMSAVGNLVVQIDDIKVESNTAEKRSFAPLLRRLKALWDSGLICDENDPLALDLDKIMRDKTKIHGFSVAYVEDMDIPFMVYAYLLRKIYMLRLKKAERYPNLTLVIKEVQKIAPYHPQADGQEACILNLSALLRECRDTKVWTYMDTQDPRSLNWEIRVNPAIYTWFIFKSDRVVVNRLREHFDIPDGVAYKIPYLPVGFRATKFDQVHSPTIYPPPLSLVKAYNEQFIVLWKRYHGSYTKHSFVFPNTDSLIRFEIPQVMPVDKAKEELDKAKEKVRKEPYVAGATPRQVVYRVDSTIGYLEEHGDTSAEKIKRILNIDPDYWRVFVVKNPLFDKSIDVLDGGILHLKKK